MTDLSPENSRDGLSAATISVSYRLIDLLATGTVLATVLGLWFVIGAWAFLVVGGYFLGGTSFWAFERRADDRWL